MKNILLTLTALLITYQLQAQHQHTDSAKHRMADTTMHHMPGIHMDHMDHMNMDMGQMMSSQFSRDLPMTRDGSGTSWVPDATPMYGYMVNSGKWQSMIHGNIAPRYTDQDLFNRSKGRGGKRVDAPNWVMAMTQRKIGSNGLLAINAMLSLDPLLVSEGGYPLLYQTGESYHDVKLVDKQHPHDLFSELSVAYTQHLANKMDLYGYFGYPGEPALGPPTFMHRLSASNDPDAPLSHHYADATHVTFGVATLGFRVDDFKLEGSIFKGREPDEHRYDFDKIGFNSYSVRLSYNPSAAWALQVSNGWIKSPEDLDPDDNVDRFTASAMNTKVYSDDSYLATTLVYGQNHHSENGKTQPSVLLESNLQVKKTAVYGRYEFVQKDADELDLLNMYPANPNLNINAFTLGVNQILTTVKKTDLRLGVQTTVNVSPSLVRNLYSTAPIGFEVYLRISPSIMMMGHHHKQMDMGEMQM